MEIIRTIIPTDLKLIKDFRDKLINILIEKSVEDDLIFKIKLILDELIINSYKHGNRCQYDKIIDTIFVLDEDYCLIKVKDEGEGIDYFIENDAFTDHGRGIKLVYSLAEELIIRDNMITALVRRDSRMKLYI
ncbi:ATP-binding protein [Anaerococcus sp. AGMB00486]|uniref:ATP-binding protein n=2 Tax=Anaerococcus TaxID=165779 RepID=A0ABX2NBJ2_9FIRM|nr:MULTISPECIES: ATP-binding protein [Anaerococcus]MDY3005604.1 ATP-binding protein [Anaerococcus porci]MSS78148.1 ATP-binding protein [Anaerococcus porci]NVF12048.1 ATP-binding protein [Anaerococcus faecalis]